MALCHLTAVSQWLQLNTMCHDDDDDDQSACTVCVLV